MDANPRCNTTVVVVIYSVSFNILHGNADTLYLAELFVTRKQPSLEYHHSWEPFKCYMALWGGVVEFPEKSVKLLALWGGVCGCKLSIITRSVTLE